MKIRQIALAVVALFIVIGATAQNKGDFRASLGLAYGTKSGIDDDGSSKGQIGITPGVEYLFTDALSGSVSYDSFFKSKVGGSSSEVSVNYSSVNIDARYYIVSGDPQVYALLGLSFLKAKSHIAGFGDFSNSDEGLNIGLGAIFPLSDNIGINGQLKYQTPGDGQVVINGGVVFMLL